MSIDAKVRAIIENRKNNFYDLLDEFKEEGELCFPNSMEPDFDFEIGSDEERIYNQKLGRFKALSARLQANSRIYYTDDETSPFLGCSYDEILGMANNGVTIPDEVLNWAYAMAESATAETTEPVQDSNDAQVLFNNLKQNPSLNIKTITKIFVNKCVEEGDELEAYLDELVPIEKEMENARVEAETKKNEALNKIKDLTKEWNVLQAKLQSGTTLTDAEQARYEELQGLFKEEDKNYQKAIDNTTKNFLKIGERLSLFTGKATTTYDFGTQTIEAARELAEFEKTPQGKTLLFRSTGSGIGDVLGAAESIGKKRFSETANTVGINTQYFSEDVTSVIKDVENLMQATADTAGFDINDPSHTVSPLSSDESLDKPAVQPTPETTPAESDGLSTDETNETPEDVNPDEAPADTEETPADETPTSEEESDEEKLADGETTLENIDIKELSLVDMERVIGEEGKDSEAKGKESIKLVEKLNAQSQIVDQKEENAVEKTTKLNETQETETPDDGTAVEDAQTEAEESQEDLEAASADEELTVTGLRETFKGYNKANKKYMKDVDFANEEMMKGLLLGNTTIVGGGTLTTLGVTNIVTGNAMLATAWLNPSAILLATHLITLGTNEIAIGSAMITSGTALSILAGQGIETNKDTSEKITDSSENIANSGKSLDEIERQQLGETEDSNSDEEQNDEEEIPLDARGRDEALLEQMNEGNDILPDLRSKSTEEGQRSSALGKDNVKQSTILKKRTPELIETTINFQQAQQMEAAQTAAPDSENEEVADVKDPAEIYDEYRNDYKADLETNKEFKQDIKATNETAKENLKLAGNGTLKGTERTALGVEEIAAGTLLIAQFWNPMAVKIGRMLIELGTQDVALGSEMLAAGLALTVNSTTTLAADEIATGRINESDEKTNESLDKADTLEAEINAAVQEQLAANGEQDMSGMSVIQLLTLIISNGINSSILGTENTEIAETLKAQLPEIIENAKANAQPTTDETQPEEETTVEPEQPEETTEEPEENQDEKKSVFAQYKDDFNADLATNEIYSSQLAQARGMAPVLNGKFFLGAPLEKATNKIKTSNEQTTTALEQVEEMEKQVEKAKEEAQKADEEALTPQETGAGATKDEEEEELTPENATDQEADAGETAEDSEAQVKKDEKTIKKQAKQEKKEAKAVKKDTRKAKRIDKEAKTADKDGQENEKLGLEQQTLGEDASANSNQDEGQTAAEQTTNELAEANEISAEVAEIASEVQNEVAETQAATKAAETENNSIVAEMTSLNSSLQQDQAQLTSIDMQIQQENQKGNSSTPAQPAPVAQPQQKPKAAPAPKKAQAPKQTPEPEADETDDKPVQPAAAPAKKPAQAPVQTPTVANAPAGADKIYYASDKEKRASFVGFVAQSDSLASGSVLADAQQSTPTPQNNNTQGNGVGFLGLKNAQNKKKAQQKKKQQEQKTQTAGGSAAPQEEKQIIAANRTTERPFDINSMVGGANGNENKTQGLRRSAQAVRTAAFNKQNRLREMAIRANNNVMARIAEEARVQAEAARKQRLAQEKQERIAKIKEYAGYVQMAGGLTTAAGMIVTKVGTVQVGAGTAQLTAGTTQLTAGTSQVAVGTTMVATGTSQLSTGGLQIGTGTAMLATGATFLTSGTVVTTSGTTMTTVGNAMIATGTAMLSNPFTAAAGAAMVASGTSLTVSGASMMASGATLTASGGTQTSTGTLQIGTGNALMGMGATTISSGMAQISAGTAQITAGTAQITAGTAMIASGTALQATGGTIQTIGTIITAAGAATSAGADIANGNILGGIASIVGAAASVVGVSAPVSQLGNAAMQLGSQGVALAGQLTTANAGQDNGGQQQNQKKKKQFQQNARTEGIIAKTAQNKQAVKNRFNK